jgi:hypothetical protein
MMYSTYNFCNLTSNAKFFFQFKLQYFSFCLKFLSLNKLSSYFPNQQEYFFLYFFLSNLSESQIFSLF